jgi:mono/diheme cytochrome c family protein
MPAFAAPAGPLSPAEIDALVAHLRGLAAADPPPGEDLAPPAAPGDPARGAGLYRALCAGCHGAAGEGPLAPALANRGLQAAASDRYLYQTMARGRPGTSMPGFAHASPRSPALAPADLADLVAFVRTLGRPAGAVAPPPPKENQ